MQINQPVIHHGVLKTQIMMGENLTLPLKPIPQVTNKHMFKPSGGLFSSTLLIEGKFASDWIRWCSIEEPDWIKNSGITFDVKKDARVLVVDCYADLEAIWNQYKFLPKELNFTIQGNTLKLLTPTSISSNPLLRYLDWEKVSRDVDAFHLTEAGQWRTRLTQPLNLYGWDCESTFFFRDVFENLQIYNGNLVREDQEED